MGITHLRGKKNKNGQRSQGVYEGEQESWSVICKGGHWGWSMAPGLEAKGCGPPGWARQAIKS
jgi:hypothetical protein